MLTEAVDAAVVISNDSDLAYPIAFARDRVPVGLVNPTRGYRAGKLAGDHTDGVGNHWWYQMQPPSVRTPAAADHRSAHRWPQDW